MEGSNDKQVQNGYDTQGHLFSEFKDASYEEWKDAATALLKGKPFEKAMYTKTPEGITLRPIYMKDALDSLPHTDVLPGFEPYVRGTKTEGNMVQPWAICQEIYASCPKQFNKRVLHDLYKGQTALNVALDRATKYGIDADMAEVRDIGYKGVSLCTLDDVNCAFQELVLEVLPLHINVGANPIPMISLLGAYLKKEDQGFDELSGVVGYDPLGFLASESRLPFSIFEAYGYMSDVMKYILSKNSKLRTILIEGHPYHEGGGDAVQELAFTMATGVEYIREMMERGINIEEITPRMAFSFSLGSNFFMELAKIRAARMLWSQIVKAFKGSDEAQKIYIHGKTSSWTKTVYDPYVNMLRNASEAFSGAIAGIDSLDIVPFDEPIRESDEFSRRISRNVQSILQDECHFTQPIDPAGGSWYIETLTYQLAEKAWAEFQKIEAEGGILQYILDNKAQDSVEEKYEEKFKNMAKRKHAWVGTNMYPNMQEEKLSTREADFENIKKKRSDEVKKYRMKKDMFQISNSISQIEDIRKVTGEISIDKAIDSIMIGATLGDIAEFCKSLTNEPCDVKPIKKQRGAERFEALRDRTEELKKLGKSLKVFLFNMGPIPQHKPRADFTTGFFEVGGFEIIKNNGFEDVTSAVQAGLESGAGIGVICSTDAAYPECVPAIAKAIKSKNPKMSLVVAGRPSKELESTYREAGIDHFIYMGADCYNLLSSFQKEVEDNE
ncbi:methylmalonyl-CoA mutase family protein [Wukongibacter sp. M2B1]|uniref:methylmalonyl-CoA mutase family protein n=1 Tax=Wukongibacter sp. M2B1 TaxID=3088895 RepID=UPI003D7AA890